MAAHTVVGAVRQAAAEATDTLVVYFAGHGLVDAQAQLCLALPHTVFGRVETGLPYDWLRKVLLLASRAERHGVILDCCIPRRLGCRALCGSGRPRSGAACWRTRRASGPGPHLKHHLHQAGEQALPHGAGELGDRVKADQDLAAAGRPDLFDAL
ncbi:hypothetical protein [Streptomyces sp. DH10]|uniref:hypothetical protein n=1 Tax=Streptomyces sp. DH10 TaxID=3040121 RepID=UPI0024421EA6|nr:hypothetical protein [Streptomyces sp. DH10]MDG9710554.1 hypothetical protein [Streptomyces sp. DH10]